MEAEEVVQLMKLTDFTQFKNQDVLTILQGCHEKTRTTVWQRMYSVDALRWKGIHGWKRLPAPGTWCAFPQTANCPIPMMV